MYVRKKKIKGKEYYYLVKSRREGNRVVQEYVEYIGPERPSESELKKIKQKVVEKERSA